MNLTKQDQVFRNPRIFHIDPKRLELDRVLINLFILLKNNGQRPVMKSGRKLITTHKVGPEKLAISEIIASRPDKLRGFEEYPDITRRWLESDLFDMVFRGVPDREAISAPRPLHLDAYRLRNPKHCRDYNAADQLYSMLRCDKELSQELQEFLAAGVDPFTEQYDEITPLDLDTLLILRLVGDKRVYDQRPSNAPLEKDPPLCYGQARLMCDDIRRLLQYKNKVPRHVLIGYLRNIMSLHLGLYTLKLFMLLPGWVNTRQMTHECDSCCSSTTPCQSYAACIYRPVMLVDMGEDYHTRMAELSRESANSHYFRMNEYIRAVFATNHLLKYVETLPPAQRSQIQTVASAIQLLENQDANFLAYFRVCVNRLLSNNDNDEEDLEQEVQRIRDMEISPFDKYVELIALKRTGFHRRYLTHLVDELFQKNTEIGAMVQGKAKINGRRFHLGSRLLETLIQIAVLEPIGSGQNTRFHSRPMLIEEFIGWLETRYGFVIDGSRLPQFIDADICDYEAFRGNINALKDRLREIGFFTDLSDAYNAQTIRPRYPID